MSSLKKTISQILFVQLFLFHSVVVPTFTVNAQPFNGKKELKESPQPDNSLLVAKNEVETQPRVTVSSGDNLRTGEKEEDDSSTVLVATGVGVGLAVLAGVAASSSSSDDGSSSDMTTGDSSETYYFKSPIRIGDDKNYNGNHEDNFKINTPSGISYSESFTLSEAVTSGKLKYTIAGAHEAEKVYMNGTLVGRTCNPGNTADAIKTCDPIDVTSNLKVGKNVMKVACVLYPGDEETPYDDAEIYNMRLEMTR